MTNFVLLSRQNVHYWKVLRNEFHFSDVYRSKKQHWVACKVSEPHRGSCKLCQRPSIVYTSINIRKTEFIPYIYILCVSLSGKKYDRILYLRQKNINIMVLYRQRNSQRTSVTSNWLERTNVMWAASSEFVSSSIPSWQISTAHAQPFRWARDLAFCLKVPLDSLLVWASSKDSGETARMRRLAWNFAARIGDKHQIRLTRPMWCRLTQCNYCDVNYMTSL